MLKENITTSQLEEDGYDPESYNITKQIVAVKNNGMNIWAISKDNKLLHWGAFFTDKEEYNEVKAEAEEYASIKTNISKNKINLISQKQANNWYKSYTDYMKKQFNNIPGGWYQSESEKIGDIFKNCIKIK